jgi:hypothetical protein
MDQGECHMRKMAFALVEYPRPAHPSSHPDTVRKKHLSPGLPAHAQPLLPIAPYSCLNATFATRFPTVPSHHPPDFVPAPSTSPPHHDTLPTLFVMKFRHIPLPDFDFAPSTSSLHRDTLPPLCDS